MIYLFIIHYFNENPLLLNSQYYDKRKNVICKEEK